QQSAARSAALAAANSSGLLRIFGLLRGLTRNKRWLAGWATNVTGFGFHATALHLGSITVVQAIMVMQLLFALPFAVAPSAPELAVARHPRLDADRRAARPGGVLERFPADRADRDDD